MANEQYKALYQKFLQDRHTPEELDELLGYFEQAEGPEDLRALIRQELDNDVFTAAEHERIDALVHRVHGRIFKKKDSTAQRMRRWLPYAAAVAVLLAVGWLLFADRWPVADDESMAATEILPGGNRATLTLANGRTIHLDEAQTGIVVGDQDITYSDGASLGLPPADTLLLTTPKGGTYQVTLPDGSKVWLNSASTLRYPSRFSGDTREVVLEGEGYFDIVGLQGTPDTRVSFKVQTAGQTVEVLGTEFNISAYMEDAETKTTLVEGKVRVEANGASLQLVPGEQGGYKANVLKKEKVDTAPFIAWKSGLFAFQSASISEVMKQLERWYDIEVVYQGKIPEGTFDGKISRDLSLQQLLRGLAQTRIDYTITGKTLTIIGDQ